MESKTWMVLVRTSTEPGAGVFRAHLQAPDPGTAINMARGMYGDQLLSESASPVYEGDA